MIRNIFVQNGVQAYSNTPTNWFDSGYPSGGNYWNDYSGSDLYSGPYQNVTGSDGIVDVPYQFAVGCQDNYPFMEPSYRQDLAITNLFSGKLSPPFKKTVLGLSFLDHIDVTVINYWDTSRECNVTLYANNTAVGQQTATIGGRSYSILAFSWNTSGFSFGNHSLSASVMSLQGETNTTNNFYTLGSQVPLTFPGDVDASFRVGPRDLAMLISSYGAPRGTRPYNPNCDIDDNGAIGPFDLAILIVQYGQHYP